MAATGTGAGCSGKDQIDTVDWGGSKTVTYTWDDRGNRTSDDDDSASHDTRDYTYDGRGNLVTVDGEWYTGSGWQNYTVSNAYDHKNRRVYKSYLDWGPDGEAGTSDDEEAQWYFYYDALDRLIDIHHVPDTDDTTTYTNIVIMWLGQRPVAYALINYVSGSFSNYARYYYHSDHQNRPLEVYDWPDSGDTSRAWAINPDLFGWDDIVTGSSLFQPLRFPGQYWDEETIAYDDSGDPIRPGLHYNWHRTYDPYTGTYLQVDPKVEDTWEAYGYVEQNAVVKTDTSGMAWLDDLGQKADWICNVLWTGANFDSTTLIFDSEGLDLPTWNDPGGCAFAIGPWQDPGGGDGVDPEPPGGGGLDWFGTSGAGIHTFETVDCWKDLLRCRKHCVNNQCSRAYQRKVHPSYGSNTIDLLVDSQCAACRRSCDYFREMCRELHGN